MPKYSDIGLLEGVGQGITKVGEMMLSDAMMQHRDERLAKLQGDATAQSQEFTAEQNRLDRESREGIAASKAAATSKKDGATNQSKNYEFMLSIGVKKDRAANLAFNGYKVVKDEATGAMQLIDVINNKTVGQMVPQDPSDFNSPQTWVDTEGTQMSGLTWDQAMEEAEKGLRNDMGWTDWIPFNEPSEEDIEGKATDLYKGGGLIDGSGDNDYSHLWQRPRQ